VRVGDDVTAAPTTRRENAMGIVITILAIIGIVAVVLWLMRRA
jgi:flagellar biogenesis protein FliO